LTRRSIDNRDWIDEQSEPTDGSEPGAAAAAAVAAAESRAEVTMATDS
jgi:hypothetical protein